jgi:hypothetical protein
MTTRRRKRQNTRTSRKKRGGSGQNAKVFLVNVKKKKASSSPESPCWPRDDLDEKADKQPCYDPVWIRGANGKMTNKVLCMTEKQRNAKLDKKQDEQIDAIQDLIEEILSKGGEEGDLVENVAESGYRSNGVYILTKKKKKFVVRHLDNDYDDYGNVGGEFCLGPSFPVGYWTFAFDQGTHVSVTGNLKSKAVWRNGNEHGEPVSKKLIKSIKKNQIIENKSGGSDVVFPWGTLRFPWGKTETLVNIKTLKYKADRVYFEPSTEEKGISKLYGID